MAPLTPYLRDRLFRARGWPRLVAARRVAAALMVLAAAVLAVRAPQARGAPTVPVLVAARDLPPGVTLGPDDVRVARSPESLRPATALTTVAEASGKVLAGAAGDGEPITRARLVGTENSHLTTGDPSAVAVPVRLADPAVAALLAPGARVDVVTLSQEEASPLLLASNATVITTRPDNATRDDRGRLVVIAVPEETATRLAAISLNQPVAVTLR